MSSRNDQVTRWRKDTGYELELFDLNTRQISKDVRVMKGFYDEKAIRKRLQKTLPDSKVIVSVRIVAYKRRLYAMPEEQYFANARVIAEEAPEKDTIKRKRG